MAAKLLLPGYGGMYTSEAFTSDNTAGVDTIDLSRCNSFMTQVIHGSTAPTAGNIQLEGSTNLTNWANLGTTNAVATNGGMVRYDITDGPFGVIRIKPASIDTGSVTVNIVGYEAQTVA